MMRSNLKGANFSGSRVIAILDNSDLSYANLSNVKWGADMKNQSMGLMRASLKKVNLTGADISNADLGRAMLKHANLTGANLQNTALFSASLEGADFTNADLRNADFTHAKVTDANFTNAKLEGAIFKKIKGKDSARGL